MSRADDARDNRIPTAFLNRFEKQFLSRRDLLKSASPTLRELERELLPFVTTTISAIRR